jgi:1,4-dihydroxy-2-naphthoate polyprenyltransferase
MSEGAGMGVWLAARPSFLVLTPSVLALAWAGARAQGVAWDGWALCLSALAAVAAHISVNALNEVADFCNGLDATTQRTPFSGGSGLLPARPELLGAVRVLAWLSLAVVVAAGGVLVAMRGPVLLAWGALGLGLVLAYSRGVVRSPLGSLCAPGLAFGPVMVVGSAVALGAVVSWPLLWLSLVPFFGVNNLLLLNQLPDVEADRAVGRRNVPIVWGETVALRVYGGMALAMHGVVVVGVVAGWLPVRALLALVMVVPSAMVWRHLQAPGSAAGLRSAMALNVVVAVVTPGLVAASLL